MSTVKGAIHSIIDKIQNRSIFNLQQHSQDKSKEIRYSKNIDFNENVVKIFFKKDSIIKKKKK